MRSAPGDEPPSKPQRRQLPRSSAVATERLPVAVPLGGDGALDGRAAGLDAVELQRGARLARHRVRGQLPHGRKERGLGSLAGLQALEVLGQASPHALGDQRPAIGLGQQQGAAQQRRHDQGREASGA